MRLHLIILLVLLTACAQKIQHEPNFIDEALAESQKTEEINTQTESVEPAALKSDDLSCMLVDQAYFDNAEGLVIFEDGCVEFADDIVYSGMMVVKEHALLDCRGHMLRGAGVSLAFRLEDEAMVENCITNHALNGYELYGSSRVVGSRAQNSEGIGFFLSGNSAAEDCLALGNANHGFRLSGESNATNCTARWNGRKNGYGYGFIVEGQAMAFDIKANENQNGLFLDGSRDESQVRGNGEFCNNDGRDLAIASGYIKGSHEVGVLTLDMEQQLASFLPCDGSV